MEALTSSLSFSIFTRTSSNITKSPSNLTYLARSEISFSPSSNFKKPYGVSFQSIPTSHAVAGFASEVMDLENQVAGNQKLENSKTSNVKFQLQKECMFGDEFFLVGDHPILGLWNPADAVTMNWSDGNIWNVELDIPIDTTIQFKFILKQSSGDMIWQPGPDRIFKSWENKNTLVVVNEDWENPEAQKITEMNNEDLELEPIVRDDNDGIMFSGNSNYAEEKLNNISITLVSGMPTNEIY